MAVKQTTIKASIAPMQSIADSLRKDDARSLDAVPAQERVQTALRLGRQAVSLCARYQGISEEEARRLLRGTNTRGRRHSRVATELPS